MIHELDITQRVLYTHQITIETDKDEEEVNQIIADFEKKSEVFMYCFDDMIKHFKEQGVTVLNSCVDEDGHITDVEVWMG